jgi:hypothetical protein
MAVENRRHFLAAPVISGTEIKEDIPPICNALKKRKEPLKKATNP